ncbi:hypothetical protein BKA70DRAFT_1506074 [Coprinopsis sp. MPI-PUGE-AT-0042]|nr:hypothetical protein BKA70DRAFT_1506074 [Coprinopsis sp. MPI-PUGE-AT-0042]
MISARQAVPFPGHPRVGRMWVLALEAAFTIITSHAPSLPRLLTIGDAFFAPIAYAPSSWVTSHPGLQQGSASATQRCLAMSSRWSLMLLVRGRGSRSSSLETSSTSEAPSFMRGVSNSQVTVGPVTVAGRDSISSTIIQYFPSFPQDPWSGERPLSSLRDLDWLSSINFRVVLLDNLKKRAPGTGLSFLRSTTFQRCLEGKIEVLLGSGMPGAGKTVLASAVIEFLQDKANASPFRDILAALVRQALERHPHLQPLVAPIYDRHRLEKTQPTQDELVFVLVSISKQFRTIFFAIDGLDEAHRFCASGPLERIESLFPNVEQFVVAATKEDIERLIDEKLDGTPALEAMMKTPSLKREVIAKVESKSKGMFLYAALQVAALQQCLTMVPSGMQSPTPLRRSTGSMQILSWLIYSRRSLKVEELQYALAMASNGFKFDPDKVVSEISLPLSAAGLVTVEDTGRLRSALSIIPQEMLFNSYVASTSLIHSL